MASRLQNGTRRVPAQERGERRVAALLEAAESIFAEHGLEAANMCQIAERAGASIGSLYQFFESKQAICEALSVRLVRAFLEQWQHFQATAATLDTAQFVHQFIQLNLQFRADHPVLPVLISLPENKGFRATARILEEQVAAALTTRRKRLPPERALTVARVMLRVIKSLLDLLGDLKVKEHAAVIAEYQALLTGYLTLRLEPRKRRPELITTSGTGE